MDMMIKINGTEIPSYPSKFLPATFDLDNGETTQRTIDGTLIRDRIAVKSQVEMEFGLLTWEQISAIYSLMSGEFFELYYPDPRTGGYVTKTMYVGNRSAALAIMKGSQALWSGLKITLTEK